MNDNQSTCAFESISVPGCGAAVTDEFTVAYVEDGVATTPHTYKVCAEHKAAIEADIADTPWQVVDEHSAA